MLSIADCLLAILWIVGGAMWLQGSTSNVNAERVGCFTVLLMTVVSLQAWLFAIIDRLFCFENKFHSVLSLL